MATLACDAPKIQKLSAEDRAILEQVAGTTKEQVWRLKFEEISAYRRVIEKLTAVRRELEEVCVDLGATNADIRR
jgi:hypothetical protein